MNKVNFYSQHISSVALMQYCLRQIVSLTVIHIISSIIYIATIWPLWFLPQTSPTLPFSPQPASRWWRKIPPPKDVALLGKHISHWNNFINAWNFLAVKSHLATLISVSCLSGNCIPNDLKHCVNLWQLWTYLKVNTFYKTRCCLDHLKYYTRGCKILNTMHIHVTCYGTLAHNT